MIRNIMIALVLVLAALAAGLSASTKAMAWGAEFAGPGPAVTGNDIGGIFPYSPDVEPIYRHIATDHCARWGRFAKVTSRCASRTDMRALSRNHATIDVAASRSHSCAASKSATSAAINASRRSRSANRSRSCPDMSESYTRSMR